MTPPPSKVALGISAALAALSQAQDDGRTADQVEAFCPDGWCEIPRMGRQEGRESLERAFEQWRLPLPQRHMITNTHISRWTEDEAEASSDICFLLKRDAVWEIAMVGRCRDVFHRDGDRWRVHSREIEAL